MRQHALRAHFSDTRIIAAAQMRRRAQLGIEQKELARLSGLSLPTIQRMEASQGNLRAVSGVS